MLKNCTTYVFIAVALTAMLLATPVSAELLCDFEGGINDYDNAASQTQGKFCDLSVQGSYINLSDNGAGNDYLVLTRSTSSQPITYYDTNVTDGNPTLLTLAVGSTMTITIDAEFDPSTMAELRIYDPVATGYGAEGFSFDFTNSSIYEDSFNVEYISSESDYSGSNIINKTTVGYHDDPIVRMYLTMTNQGSGIEIGVSMDAITELGGAVTSHLGSSSAVVSCGAGVGELDMDPVVDGFEIGLSRNKTTATTAAELYIDNLTVTTVPEPSTVALLATGLIGLLAYAWRKRK